MKITYKEVLVENLGIRITKIKVAAPHIAARAKPGQFAVVMISEEGERIPLTIVDKDEETITLIFQEVGFSTKSLGRMNVGDSLYAIAGPLGHCTEIKNYGRTILLAGGVGIAEIYPVAKALKTAGSHITIILGSRTKALLILENELRKVSDEFYVTTDDGSYGRKGFTIDELKELLAKQKYDLVYSVGPIPMMRRTAEATKSYGIKTIVSLNAIMVDATGMCGGCRVSIGGEAKFSCVDGPEFDGHLVDWNQLEKRNRVYDEKEKHICRIAQS